MADLGNLLRHGWLACELRPDEVWKGVFNVAAAAVALTGPDTRTAS